MIDSGKTGIRDLDKITLKMLMNHIEHIYHDIRPLVSLNHSSQQLCWNIFSKLTDQVSHPAEPRLYPLNSILCNTMLLHHLFL